MIWGCFSLFFHHQNIRTDFSGSRFPPGLRTKEIQSSISTHFHDLNLHLHGSDKGKLKGYKQNNSNIVGLDTPTKQRKTKTKTKQTKKQLNTCFFSEDCVIKA